MAAIHAPLLPDQPVIRLQQSPGTPDSSALDKIDHLLVALPEKPAASAWEHLPDGSRLQALYKRQRDGVMTDRLHNAVGTGISAACLKGTAGGNTLPDTFAILAFAGKLAATALRDRPAAVAIMAVGFAEQHQEAIAAALVLALHAHAFALPAARSESDPVRRVRSIRLLGFGARLNMQRTLAEANALNLARWLTALPPNRLDTPGYREAIAQLADGLPWESRFLGEAELRELGAGAFLAVAQGNAARDAGIMHIRYRPAGTAADATPQLSLVGKGIIFDTGGTNLKPFKAMLDMHCDMAGSAVALATLVALTAMKYPHPVDCWLAITENRLSNEAYKSRDVVTASNGRTIEIIHTDAEGRMALADALALAGREKPAAIIDFATLTGSCVVALTDRYSGVFCNRDTLHDALLTAGRQSGERVWPFPMDADFDEDLKSTAADTLQCAAAGGGDHIQAAQFLQHFVPETVNWVHVDLGAATRTGGLAQVPTEITGFGVRYALSLILDHQDALVQTVGTGR